MAAMNTYSVELDVRDKELLALVTPDTSVEQIATNLLFTEGPVWHSATDSLIFSDILGDTIYRWSRPAGLHVFRRPSNMANGNMLDRQGRLLTCEHASSRVTRTAHDGTIKVLASHYHGKELNSPNDIVVHTSGAIYFTDPTSGRTARYGIERSQQLSFQGVYRLDPETRALAVVAEDFDKPNGLCFSRDEQRLFVNDTTRAHIRVFAVHADGTLTGGQVWAELVGAGEGVADGMKLDAQGNVYCCGPGGIHVFAPDARNLGVIRLPEKVANFAWGDADWRTLYMTASTSVYAIRTQVAGHPALA